MESWTTIREVLDKMARIISPTEWSELDVLDSAAEAMEKLRAYPMLEHHISIIQLEQHKAKLPRGLLKIDQVAYKVSSAITEDDLDELKAYIGHPNDDFYDGFLTSPYFTRCYLPLRRANSTFQANLANDTNYNLNINGEHIYSVDPSGTLTASIKDGYVAIAYVAYPKDDCGDFLIPDDEDFKDALYAYCMMKYWEQQWNASAENAGEKFQYYVGKWATMRKAVHGKMLLPSIEDYEDIRQMTDRLVPKKRRYYSFFGNLANSEELDVTGNFVTYGNNTI